MDLLGGGQGPATPATAPRRLRSVARPPGFGRGRVRDARRAARRAPGPRAARWLPSGRVPGRAAGRLNVLFESRPFWGMTMGMPARSYFFGTFHLGELHFGH